MLVAIGGREGWAFLLTAVAIVAVTVTLFGSLYPNVLPSSTNPAFSLTTTNASSTPYTLAIMSWVALVFTPIVLAYQAWTFWVFRRRISPTRHPGSDRVACRNDGPRHGVRGGLRHRRRSARTMKPLDPRLLRHASAARRFVILAAATAVLTAGLVLVQAQLLASGVTRAFLGGDTLVALAPVLVALLVVVACRAALAWLGEVAAHRASTDVIRQLRSKLVAHALRLGPRHGGLPPTGELATLATRGLDGLEGYFSRYLPTLLVAAVVPAVVACRILFADLLSGVIVGLTVPLIPIFMILVGLHTQRSTRRQWRALAVLGHHFLDLVAGLDVLVAFGRAPHQSSRLRTLATEYRRATMQTLRVAFLSALVLELLATLSVALIAVSVGLRLVEGRLDLFTGLVVLILAPEVYLPLRAVGARFHDSAEGLAAASEAFAVLETQTPGGAGRVPAPNPARVSIQLEGVAVERPGGPDPRRAGPAARSRAPCSGCAGPAAAGKSTLVDLLLGLRTPDEGRVLVGGVDLADVDRDAWLRRIAWVPQRPTLVRGTVADNIRLGQPFASPERVAAAAEAAALDIPLDTPVGEDGNGLSTGQQRRVALARAVLADRPLLLLDEPTEGVDADTEVGDHRGARPGHGGTHRRAGEPPAGAARRVRPAARRSTPFSPRPPGPASRSRRRYYGHRWRRPPPARLPRPAIPATRRTHGSAALVAELLRAANGDGSRWLRCSARSRSGVGSPSPRPRPG